MNATDDASLRKQRHLLYLQNAPVVRAAWAGGEGYACITSRGILGSCQSFPKCYPYFKFPPPAVRYPVLNSWDTWILGNYDTCSYHADDGRAAHGVCCTNPVTPAASQPDDTEQNKIDTPPIQHHQFEFSSWPPPIPTHPPDHTPATHPPAFGIFGIQADQKPTSTTKRPTTWATRPPIGSLWPPTNQPVFAPLQTTTKRPTFVVTTESPIINEVSFDAGSCGAKNGFQVRGEMLIMNKS